MGSVVEYNHRSATSKLSVGSGGDGGDVDDILRRLGNVETSVTEVRKEISEVRREVSAIAATIPFLATAVSVAEVRTEIAEVRTEVAEVRSDVRSILAIIPNLATKADVSAGVSASETAFLRWFIATALTVAALAFTIAKFVH
jgi:seryl-tRNA synthetase